MKLWILRPKGYANEDYQEGAWSPWYDKAFGFVVCAMSEQEARTLAAQDCGNECEEAWMDPDQSTCEELKPDGDARVIMRDFRAA